MLRVFILVVITMTISNVHALDERNATINLINDFATCFAFWSIVEQAAPNPNDTTFKKGVQKEQLRTMSMGKYYTKKLGLKEESFDASIENKFKNLFVEEMDGMWGNFIIVKNKYYDLCVSFRTEYGVAERFLYWKSQ
tara:strand:- start:202 stop:615 length:414 start_codon:yes stop_codon:yes gene_type:complete